MDIIQNNPYRIAGILSSASEREMQKQKSKATKYSSIGRNVTSEYDFSILEDIERSESSINRAFARIQQNPDKVMYSLFWFLKSSAIDETVINYLSDGNEEKALEILGKVTNGKEVNSSNFSAFNNIGTLKLLSNSRNEISEGIESKLKLIESEYFEKFVHSVADETYMIDRQKQSQHMINELVGQFKVQFTSSEISDLFSNCNGENKKYLVEKLVEDPFHLIEKNIEKSKLQRKEKKSDSYNHAVKLINSSAENLGLVKSLLGKSDLKYKMIADNLAKEMLQCGIDYFNYWKDNKDPSSNSLKIIKYAKTVAVGSQTLDRIKENIGGMTEWAKNAPIEKDIDFITKELETFKHLPKYCSNAKDLLVSCKPKLNNIKIVLGGDSDLYLGISRAIVSHAQAMIVAVVNKSQEDLYEYELKSVLKDALEVSKLLDSYDMDLELRKHYRTNDDTLKSIATRLGATSAYSHSTSSDDDTNWGSVVFWIIVAIVILSVMAG